ncbi:MAG: hypothetical protein AB8I08_24210 [Sandaracinaceae bacterium]
MSKWGSAAMLAMVLATSTALVSPSMSAAQGASVDDEAARRHFRLGQAHYENGEFAEAAAQFEASYEASPRPRLLYNAYVAYRDLQDTANAERTLRLYLEQIQGLDPGERAQLQRRLEALESARERGGTAEPADATEPAEPTAPPPSEATSSETAAPSSGGGFSPSPVGFIVAGAGLALGVAAVVTGVLSADDFSQLDTSCPGGACPDTAELRDTRSRGEALAVTTDVLWITGAAALAAGVVLIFVLQDSSEDRVAFGGACTMDGCAGTLGGSF